MTPITNTLFPLGEFLLANFSVKDAFDIGLTALFVFGLLFLLRKTKSLPVMAGLAVLAAAYAVAYSLNLSLTLRLFQLALGAFVVILAVVFQGELRRFFWMIGLLGMRGRHLFGLHGLSRHSTDVLVDASWVMASKRIGALIVIPGKESIEQYATEGIELDAKLSRPILLSIFNTAAPGHDGAIVVRENRIKRFGVYLPLSQESEQLKRYGSRHRAALGLAERTDALCIVVSEEKGEVAIARDGELVRMRGQDDLVGALEEFFAAQEEQSPQARVVRILKALQWNALLAAISVAVASLLWISLNYPSRGVVQQSFIAPVEFYNVAPGMVVSDTAPHEIVVTFSAKSQDFRLLDSERLKVSVDVGGDAKPGEYRITLVPGDVAYPAALALVRLDPEVVLFTLSRQTPPPNGSATATPSLVPTAGQRGGSR